MKSLVSLGNGQRIVQESAVIYWSWVPGTAVLEHVRLRIRQTDREHSHHNMWGFELAFCDLGIQGLLPT